MDGTEGERLRGRRGGELETTEVCRLYKTFTVSPGISRVE